jgi:putative transcriptional regulator
MRSQGTIAPLGPKVDARLRELEAQRPMRDTRRWTRFRLASEMGISDGNLWNLLERPALGIRWEMLARLCSALDCQPGLLLEYVPNSVNAKTGGRNGKLERAI